MKRLVTISLFVLSGCTHFTVDTLRLDQNVYDAKPLDCKMPVLYQQPKNTIIVAAIAAGKWVEFGPNKKPTLNELLPHMKKEACKLGADALLIEDVKPGAKAWTSPIPADHAVAHALKYKTK